MGGTNSRRRQSRQQSNQNLQMGSEDNEILYRQQQNLRMNMQVDEEDMLNELEE